MSSAPGQPFDAQPIGLIAANLVGYELPRKTRALLSRGDSPRTGQPVWRNSYYVGQIEDRIWKPINGGSARGGKRWTGALLKAAKALELKTRAERRETDPGCRNGVLGDVGIAVLEYLYEHVDFMTGRLDPAIRTIADAIGRAYSAVHLALCRLREAGFISWMRRSEKLEDPEPGGPQVKQASNAYALHAPPSMREWLGRLFGKAPTPACEEDRRRQQKAEFERMLAGLTAREYSATFNRDPYLGDVLGRIAALVDEREARSANPPGPMKPGDHSDP
ncbi:LexA family transcriptional regulator [Alteraurantiacibacter palmitatis]|uniref:Helix-turn-helix domain-containing protein n=1 Tax=Alteraurantiacibacter palmitatis TaxID=2054628 RepID=A0ABV7E750_9SPHN